MDINAFKNAQLVPFRGSNANWYVILDSSAFGRDVYVAATGIGVRKFGKLSDFRGWA